MSTYAGSVCVDVVGVVVVIDVVAVGTVVVVMFVVVVVLKSECPWLNRVYAKAPNVIAPSSTKSPNVQSTQHLTVSVSFACASTWM